MIKMKLRFSVKVYYDVLIYKTTKEFLTLHVYLVPPDRHIQQVYISVLQCYWYKPLEHVTNVHLGILLDKIIRTVLKKIDFNVVYC